MGLGVLTLCKYAGGSEYVLTRKMSHPLIQDCCWITLQVSYHQVMKDYSKNGR